MQLTTVYTRWRVAYFYPDEQRWVAMFLKFQSQAEHTDDVKGNPIEEPAPKVRGSIRLLLLWVTRKLMMSVKSVFIC
jgi:hypothetical protein